MDFTKQDLFVIIQALNAYDIECARMFTRIADPYISDKRVVLKLEEFDEVHNIIGEVRKKATEQYQSAK